MINLYRVVDNLVSLVKSKYEQLQDVYVLTEQQSNAIETLDMEELNRLIDEKQERINLIMTFDSQFEAIVDDIKTIYEIKSLDELEFESDNIIKLKDMISKVTGILRQILQIENSNKEKMNASKLELEMKMKNAQTGKIAMKQYSGISNYSDAVFFDRKVR